MNSMPLDFRITSEREKTRGFCRFSPPGRRAWHAFAKTCAHTCSYVSYHGARDDIPRLADGEKEKAWFDTEFFFRVSW